MATISIGKKHRLSHRKARDIADRIARDLKERFHLEYAWTGDHVEFHRPGIAGRMEVGKDAIRLGKAFADDVRDAMSDDPRFS